MWQNSAYMISTAWNSKNKKVIFLCLASLIARVMTRVLHLFLSPTILKKVELRASFGELVLTIAMFSIALMISEGAVAYIGANTIFGRVRVRMSIVGAIHRKINTTSYPNTEDSKVLKLMEKAQVAVRGNNEAAEAIWDILTNAIHDIICLLICLTLLTALNPILMLISLATTLTGYFVNKRIDEWGYRHKDEEAKYMKRLSYILEESENIKLAKDIRIFGMKSWLEEVYQKTMRLYEAFIRRGEKVYIWTNVIDLSLTFLRNGVVYVYLIGATIRQGMPASEFLLYFDTVNRFTSRIGYILWNFGTLHKQSLDICNVREFLELPEEFLFDEGEKLEPVKDGEYEIRLEHVSFRYPEATEDTIHDMSLTIRPGEKLAIVGLNGAGKTTLVKLICGYYNPTSGRVLLNGVDIRNYDRRDYYRHFAAVFQQFSVLEASLAINVSQDTENVDESRIWDCLEKAGMTEKVQGLPKGLETAIGRKVYEDGIELSGGQMQRVMLARALYKEAPIIVLDEPTAALDPIAENDMYQKYNEFTRGRTSVYISHRLASTRFCDRIIYLENGNILEEGTHVELLAKNGEYAKLFEIQSKYYREGVEKDAERQTYAS